ncbi:hypothetical protein GCM10009785_31180 [Brooklawnia cerclae]
MVTVLVVAPAFAPFLEPEMLPSDVLSWSAALVPALVLPLRRRAPVAVLVALVALFAITAIGGPLLPGIGLAIAVAVFHLANDTSRKASLVVGGVVMGVMTAISVTVAVTRDLDAHVFQFIVTIAFAAAAGDATRSRREYLVAVTERADRAEQTREAEARRRVTEERLRIARDLHDAVAHQIAVISLNAGVASTAMDTDPERARAALGTIRGAARTVLAEIGDLLSMLRSDGQDAPATAPQPGLGQLDELMDQFSSTGLEVHRRIEGDLSRVRGSAGMVAYRVVQESLTNAHKYGSGHRAHVLVAVLPETLRIVVTNPVDHGAPASVPDGAATPVPGAGVGLIGIRERVSSVRGTVHAGLVPGGWRVSAELPIPKEETT